MNRSLAVILGAVMSTGALSTQTFGQTIADIVTESGGEFDDDRSDFDLLLNAVITADLVDTLADASATFTVFAPNDGAFIKLARDLGYMETSEEGAWNFLVGALTDLGGGDPVPVLTDILLYHVAPEYIAAIDLVFITFGDGFIQTALPGGTLGVSYFRLIDNEPDLRDPRVILPFDVVADNGVIHTIGRVLVPIDLP